MTCTDVEARLYIQQEDFNLIPFVLQAFLSAS